MMSDLMSSVYSGGLMYEYSVEENKYGIVEISDDEEIERLSEFKLFKEALADNPAPEGDGGASPTSASRPCPTSGDDWNVDPSLLPVMPEEAQAYFEDGAGEGPGLDGDGSQWNADSGTATASTTGGDTIETGGASGSDEEDDDSAASPQGIDKAAFLVTGGALFFTLFGTLLL